MALSNKSIIYPMVHLKMLSNVNLIVFWDYIFQHLSLSYP